MKTETLQLLLLSWLRNIKECQMAQTSWKPASKWELKHKEILEQIIQSCINIFRAKYDCNLNKGDNSIQQQLSKAEIDLIGISFSSNKEHFYAIEVVFNEDATKDETVSKVIKKCIITAMCMFGYFGIYNGTIILIFPKIELSLINDISACSNDFISVLNDIGLNYKIQIIANEDFNDKVIEPVFEAQGDISAISDLSVKNLQMDNLFLGLDSKTLSGIERNTTKSEIYSKPNAIEYVGADKFKEMKIGVIVRKVLAKMLENGEVSKQEINMMQVKQYSKQTFDIQFPLLQKSSITKGISPLRYYSSPINIYGENYFLCSEWYEGPANNDRPYLLKWFALHKN